MTTKSIQEQIAAIKAVTSKANVSKETALAFLKSAGIIEYDLVKGKVAKLSQIEPASKIQISLIKRKY